MVFAIVPDQHETNCVSLVNTKCQPDIQSLASSALLPNQSLVALPLNADADIYISISMLQSPDMPNSLLNFLNCCPFNDLVSPSAVMS
jgi:hypothetical protein